MVVMRPRCPEFEKWGARWECLIGYEVLRNGWWFALHDITDGGSEMVLFAFRPDATGVLEITQARNPLPAEMVAWFAQEAAEAIPPVA